MYTEVIGDIFNYVETDKYDVISHGCNCFCTMGAGIAPLMAEHFKCDGYPLESNYYMGDYNKMGQIDYKTCIFEPKTNKWRLYDYKIDGIEIDKNIKRIIVINSYTQYTTGLGAIDYDALRLCMRKINHEFKGLKVILPRIGAGLAGGNWDTIRQIFIDELSDCNVTVVIHPKDL